MKRIAFLVALLSSCGHVEAVCVSRCGVLQMQSTGATCEEFQAAEDRALREFVPLHPNGAALCGAWEGWKVRTHVRSACGSDSRRNGFVDQWGRCVEGYTSCETRTIVIGLDPDWSFTAYPHELLHATDCPAKNMDHTGWDVWQNAAIERARF